MADTLRITVLAGKTFRGVQHFQNMNYDASTELAKHAVESGDAEWAINRQTFLSTPITTLEEAKVWITSLHFRGLDFHFEDFPETIVNGPTGQRLFTDEEVPLVRARINELYGFDYGEAECPIGYLLDVTNYGWRDL